MKIKLNKIIKYTASIMIINLFAFSRVLAQQDLQKAKDELKAKLVVIFNFIFGVAGAIFVVVVIAGGLMYLTSGGSEEQATKAKKALLNGVIGIVLTVGAYAISSWILQGLGGEMSDLLQ